MNHSRFLNLCMLICIACTVACSKPYGHPIVEPDRSFTGIEDLLEANGAAVLITIHGMCYHDEKWFEESRDRFAVKSSMSAGPIIQVSNSDMSGALLYRSDLTRQGQLFRMYGIIFSEMLLEIKQKALCQDVKRPTVVCPESLLTYKRHRAKLNDALKNRLLNDCLADAVAYLGPAGDTVRTGVREAVFAAIADIRKHETLANAPIAFLSESLGSKILGDSLFCASDEDLLEILPDLDRTSHIFLGANQIPLLNLGYREIQCKSETAIEAPDKIGRPLLSIDKKRGGIAGFLDILDATRGKGFKDRVVVAFNDPNDLLSYEVRPEDIGDRPVVNILVSNDYTYLRWAEHPLNAHTGYRENPDVIEFVRCGRTVGAKTPCP